MHHYLSQGPFLLVWSRVLCTAQIQRVKVRLCEDAVRSSHINKGIVLEVRACVMLWMHGCIYGMLLCSCCCTQKTAPIYSPLLALLELCFVPSTRVRPIATAFHRESPSNSQRHLTSFHCRFAEIRAITCTMGSLTPAHQRQRRSFSVRDEQSAHNEAPTTSVCNLVTHTHTLQV